MRKTYLNTLLNGNLILNLGFEIIQAPPFSESLWNAGNLHIYFKFMHYKSTYNIWICNKILYSPTKCLKIYDKIINSFL